MTLITTAANFLQPFSFDTNSILQNSTMICNFEPTVDHVNNSSGINPKQIRITVQGEDLILNAHRYIYRPYDESIICADIHIGKAAHFRKNGIAIPTLVNKNNFWNLSSAFDFYQPKKFVVLGDMVHSTENHEWDDLADFLANYPRLELILVRGNHEVEHDQTYQNLGFQVVTSLHSGSFTFCHDPEEIFEDDNFKLCGHIHPAIQLYGKGKQHLRVSCFWLSENQLVLPAFGTFTGTHSIKPKKSDRIFAVTENEILELNRAIQI